MNMIAYITISVIISAFGIWMFRGGDIRHSTGNTDDVEPDSLPYWWTAKEIKCLNPEKFLD